MKKLIFPIAMLIISILLMTFLFLNIIIMKSVELRWMLFGMSIASLIISVLYYIGEKYGR